MLTQSASAFTIPEEIDPEFNNVLYVDDEESNLRIFDSVFSRYYNIFTATSGQVAIKLLRQYDIHMIITDQKMPEMTGTDLLEQTLEEFPDIIRIILTGFADIQAIIRAINKCSIYKYITKPYENAEMKEIIEKGLRIFNSRKKKYADEKVPTTANTNFNEQQLNGSKEILPLIVEDSYPDEFQFQQYFDHHIRYIKAKSGFRDLHYDFHVREDEASSKLYFFSLHAPANAKGSLIYMHLKNRLRKVSEMLSEEAELPEIMDRLEEMYLNNRVDVKPLEFQLISYDWTNRKLEYLTKQEKLRVYKCQDQLELVSMDKVRSDKSGYNYFRLNTDTDLMIYFFDAVVKPNSTFETVYHNMGQIISNASSSPFDLQPRQVSAGAKSIEGDVEDMLCFGLLLNE